MKTSNTFFLIIITIISVTGVSNAQSWKLTGNSGTTGTNFIGTTDGQALAFKVNNQKAGSLEYSPLFANTTFGYQSLASNVSGKYNTTLGYQSLYSNFKGSSNTAAGYQSLFKNSSGESNTAIGFTALYNNLSGTGNTAQGPSALYNNTSGNNNVAIGRFALYNNTTGFSNVALGKDALFHIKDGKNLVAIGDSALYSQVDGYSGGGEFINELINTAIGSKALFSNLTGYANTAIGRNALYANKSGNNNTGVGDQSLSDNISGSGNSSFGSSSLTSNETGDDNSAFGDYSLGANYSGHENCAFGISALGSNTDGSYNTAVGVYSLSAITKQFFNTAVGWRAGSNHTSSASTFIGHKASSTIDNIDNSTAIGFLASVTASNQVRIGSSTVTSIGGHVNWTTLSDKRFKKDIKQNVPGLEFINKLQPITYHIDATAISNYLKEDRGNNKESKGSLAELNNGITAKEKVMYTGFAAQDVEKAAKEINYDFSGIDAPKNQNDYYGLRYSEFVVPLVKAVQELSKANDDKDSLIKDLQKQINELKSVAVQGNRTENIKTVDLSTASLEQNAPNPFNSSTVIRYHISASVSNAQIMVTNARGNTIKTFALNNKGAGSVTIQAGELAAGSYYYTLIIDGKKVDSKQMILNK